MKKIFVFVFFLMLLTVSAASAGEGEIEVKFYGHSYIKLTMPNGKVIIIDPFSEKVGYKVPEVSADIVLVTHEHHDHNNVSSVGGNPKVLRGLTEDGKDYNKIDYVEDGIKIYSVNSYHDKENGAERGKNATFVIEVDGKKIVHLGDLGNTLTDEQIKEIGDVCLLFVPVGGHFTIDDVDATTVVNQLNPEYVVPMHFKTAMTGDLPIAKSYGFVRNKKFNYVGKSEYTFPLKKKTKFTYFLLGFSKD